ncbi:MAG: Ig-like domain-containing protein [Planctomycetaceae bacterium]
MLRLHWLKSLSALLSPNSTGRRRRAASAGFNGWPAAIESLEERTLLSATVLDSGFGQNGVAVTDGFGGVNTQDQLVKVLQLGSGKLLAVGNSTVDPLGSSPVSGISAALYRVNGDLETPFGTAGKVFHAVDFVTKDALLLSDGSVLLVGGTSNGMAVAHLLSNGSLDTGFGIGGVSEISIGANDLVAAEAAVLDSEGRILLVGTSKATTAGTTDDLAVVRLSSNGTVDASFGTDGLQAIDFGGTLPGSTGEEAGLSLTRDSQGRILVGGVSDVKGFVVARLTNAGGLDTSFSTDGLQTVDSLLFKETELNLLTDALDRPVLVGEVTNLLGGSTYFVTRLTDSGATDLTYATNGILQGVLSTATTTTTDIAAPVIDTAGNLLLGYSVDDAVSVLQLTTAGIPDASFGINGLLSLGTNPVNAQVNGMLLDEAGNLLLSGVSTGIITLQDFNLMHLIDPLINSRPHPSDDMLSTTERAILSGNLILDDNGFGSDIDDSPGNLIVVEVNGMSARVGATTRLASGALVLVYGDGSYTYNPNGRFERLNVGESAADTFTYTVEDAGGLQSTATVTVTVHGANDGFTFTGETLFVRGTTGNDLLRYVSEAGRVTLNGLHASLGADIVYVSMDGQGGDDQLVVIGSQGNDRVMFRPAQLLYEDDPTHSGYDLSVQNVSRIQIHSQGGLDHARIDGTGNDDRIVSRSVGVAMISGGDIREVLGFAEVYVTSSLGNDRALLVGSADSDTLTARDGLTTMNCSGRVVTVEGFGMVAARGAGGVDRARFIGGAGFDALRARPGAAVFSSGPSNIHTEGFELVSADGQGGVDRAALFGDAGDDSLSANADTLAAVFLSGGHQFSLQGFDHLLVQAGSGGVDVATLIDSAGDDLLTAQGPAAELRGHGFFQHVQNFDVVRLRGINGGFNRLTPGSSLLYELLPQGSWT